MNHKITAAPDIEPLTPLEKLPQSAQDIYAREENQSEQEYARYEAHQKQRDRQRIVYAETSSEFAKNEREPKPSQKLAERLEAKMTKARAGLKALDATWEEQTKFRPGSMFNVIGEFLRSPAANKKYVPAETHDELLEGETPAGMVALCRKESKRLLAERDSIMRAPKPAAEIEADVRTMIRRHTANLSQTISGLRHVSYNEQLNAFRPRPDYLPEIRVADGAGSLATFGDGMGLFFALMGDEAAEKLIAMALHNHDEARALGARERQRRLQENDAATVANAYRAEFWHRHCMNEGINPGARVTSNALAILDIRET